MESRQLRYVVQVAHAGSVTKAAQELFLSRQAVSKAVHALEQELGLTLFDRAGDMRPTEDGACVLAHIERALAEFDEIELYARSRRHGAPRGGALAVAFKLFPLDYLFFADDQPAASLVRRFADRSPGLLMTRYSLPDTAIVDALVAGTVDVGFIQGRPDRSDIACEPVAPVDTRVIVPRGSPLAARGFVRMEDLASVPIRSPLDFDAFTTQFVAQCRRRGFEPQFSVVPLNDEGIEEFTRVGGVHIQPYGPLMQARFPELAFLPFAPDDRIDLPLCMVWRTDADNPEVKRIVAFWHSGLHGHGSAPLPAGGVRREGGGNGGALGLSAF